MGLYKVYVSNPSFRKTKDLTSELNFFPRRRGDIRMKEEDRKKLTIFFSSLYRHCSRNNNINLRFSPNDDEENLPVSLSEIESIPFTLVGYEKKDAYFRIATEGTIQIPAIWVALGRGNKVLDRLKRFLRKPTAIVNTGDGYNAYWRLKTPATKDQIREIEPLLKGIASHLGGDMEMAAWSSILRIPWTWNFQCNKPVTIEGIIRSGSEYDLGDFDFLTDDHS
jgi:hypothetical protein